MSWICNGKRYDDKEEKERQSFADLFIDQQKMNSAGCAHLSPTRKTDYLLDDLI